MCVSVCVLGRGGGVLVNVSGVSPGPERRVSDSRTMAAGTIEKHSCCECTLGSVSRLAISQHMYSHSLTHMHTHTHEKNACLVPPTVILCGHTK